MEAAIGFLIAAVVGIGLALIITYSASAGSAMMNSLVAVNATPKVAVALTSIIWLGLGMESKIALAFLLSFFPIVVNAVRGFADVPHDLLNLYRLMHATPTQVFRKVRLPSALPAIFDGFKIALPVALIGAVAGEFVAARSGLGFQIVLAYGNFNSALVFAAVITIALEATLLFQVLILVEDRAALLAAVEAEVLANGGLSSRSARQGGRSRVSWRPRRQVAPRLTASRRGHRVGLPDRRCPPGSA